MGGSTFGGSGLGRPAPGRRPTMGRWLLVVGTLLVIAVAALLSMYATIRADLPVQVASHWGGDGIDSTQSPRAFITTTVALLVGLSALQALIAWFIPVEGRRVLGVAAAALIGLLGLGLGGTLWSQRGLTDPYAAPSPGGWLALGFALAVPLAGLAWWLLPTHIPDLPAEQRTGMSAGAPRFGAARAGVLASGASGSGSDGGGSAELPWRDRVPAGSAGAVMLGLLVVLAVGLAVTPARWVAVPVVLLVALLVGSMARSELVVDQEGVRVQAYGRVRWLRAPKSTIAFADVEPVRPLAQFGGYGLRYGMRGRGFVTVAGPALHLSIPGSADTWISCAHPELAAALVNELLSGREA